VKRIASILLLIILLFNFIGYQLLSSYMEDRANQKLEAKLDKNDYDDADLISFKVPVTHLSYYNNSNQFKRVDGQIEVNGVQYKYVKSRIFNDSVELLCIPNETAMKLKSAKDEFFRLVNDLQHTGQSKKSESHSYSKNFSVDNYTYVGDYQFLYMAIITTKSTMPRYDAELVTSYSSIAEQPPEIC